MITVLALFGVIAIAILSEGYERHLDKKLERKMDRLMGRSGRK